MRGLVLAFCLVCCSFVSAQPPTPAIKLPETIHGSVGSFITVPATTVGTTVKWYSVNPGLNIFPVELLKDSKTLVVTASRDGEYRLLAYTALDGVPSDIAETRILIGTVVPPNPVPVPTPVPPSPTPTPTPVPPGPAPNPIGDVGPIRFLIVYETELQDDNGKPYKVDPLPVIYSTKIRDYLKDKCVKVNGHPEFRVWDDDYTEENLTAAGEGANWKRVYFSPRDSEPWYYLSNDKRAKQGPLPKTEDEMLNILKQYGGL